MVGCMDHEVHHGSAGVPLINRPRHDMLIPKFIAHTFDDQITTLVTAHGAKILPVGPAPPICKLVQILLSAESAFKPTVSEEVKELDFHAGLLVFGNFLHSGPVALKCSLIKQAEGGFLLRDCSAVEYVVDALIKVTRVNLDVPDDRLTGDVSRWLGCLHGLKSGHLLLIDIAKMEMAKSPGLALQDQLCRPCISLFFLLRPGEAIDIGTVFRDVDEVPEIPHNEARLVVRPHGVRGSDDFNMLLRLFGYVEQVGLLRLRGGIVRHYFPLLRDRLLPFAEIQNCSPQLSVRRAPSTGVPPPV